MCSARTGTSHRHKRWPREDDEETEDGLPLRRSELRIARRLGSYREKKVEGYPLTRTQIGFLQVALLNVLQTAEYPERVQHAAIFMAEAKLKIKHGMDIKKVSLKMRR